MDWLVGTGNPIEPPRSPRKVCMPSPTSRKRIVNGADVTHRRHADGGELQVRA